MTKVVACSGAEEGEDRGEIEESLKKLIILLRLT
jgi:hypothetical protein